MGPPTISLRSTVTATEPETESSRPQNRSLRLHWITDGTLSTARATCLRTPDGLSLFPCSLSSFPASGSGLAKFFSLKLRALPGQAAAALAHDRTYTKCLLLLARSQGPVQSDGTISTSYSFLLSTPMLCDLCPPIQCILSIMLHEKLC